MGISRLFSWIRLRQRPVVASPAADAPAGAEPGSDSAAAGEPADAEPPGGGYVVEAAADNKGAVPGLIERPQSSAWGRCLQDEVAGIPRHQRGNPP